MRPGQHQNNKRMRGRNRGGGGGGKGPNPLNRSYESNGPDVKIRGSAQHIAEKYLQLARDAQGSGDRVMAENYMQHAEHYFRLLAAAQAQFAPHLPAYVRPDEQSLDDDDDFDETDPQAVPPAGEMPAPPPQQQQPAQGGYQQGGGQQREFRPRWERGDRGDRPERYERQDRGERFDRRERGERFQQAAEPRPELGEQPSVEFPERREQAFEPREPREAREPREPRPARSERVPRPERAPRPERTEIEAPQLAAANGEPAVEAAAPVESEEGREPGLPSFLTRGRRRGRPPYRRREDDGEAAEGAEAPVTAGEEPSGAAPAG
jgi:hypothetical protein